MRIVYGFYLILMISCLPSAALSLSLRNPHISVNFNPTSAVPESIEDLRTNVRKNLLTQAPWSIVLRRASAPYDKTPALHPSDLGCNTPYNIAELNDAGTSRIAVFYACSYDESNMFDLAVVYELGADSDFFSTRIAADGSGLGYFDPSLRPALTAFGISELRQHITLENTPKPEFGLLSIRFSTGVKEPAETVTEARTINDIHSAYWDSDAGITDRFSFSGSHMAYYDNHGDGIYAFPEIVTGYENVKSAYRSVNSGEGFQVTFISYLEGELEPLRIQIAPLPIRIGLFKSPFSGQDGWFTYSEIYKAYLANNSAVLRQGKVSQRADIPNFFKTRDVLFDWFGIERTEWALPWTDPNFRNALTTLYEDSKNYFSVGKMPIGFFMGWNDYAAHDHSEYALRPGEGDFFRELSSKGMNPMVYMLASAIGVNNPHYSEFSPNFARDPFGNIETLSDPLYGQYSLVDNSLPIWGDYMADVIGELNSNYGIIGNYFDGSLPGPLDFSSDRPHDRGQGEYQISGTLAALERARQGARTDDYFYLTENFEEWCIASCDIQGADTGLNYQVFKSAYWDDLFEIPGPAAFYHEYSPLIGIGIPALTADPRDYMYVQADYVFRQGALPAFNELARESGILVSSASADRYDCSSHSDPSLCRAITSEAKNQANLMQEVAAYSKLPAALKFLVDGSFQMPTQNSIPLVSKVFTFPAHTRALPKFPHGVWKAEDGSLGIFFFNHTAQDEAISFRMDFERYGLSAGSQYVLTKIPSTGRSEFLRASSESFTQNVTLAAGKVLFLQLALNTDTHGPEILVHSSSTEIPIGSDFVLELSTDEPAKCRYSTESAVFNDMQILESVDGINHRAKIDSPPLGELRITATCRDALGNFSTASISRTVIPPTVLIHSSFKRTKRRVILRGVVTSSTHSIAGLFLVVEKMFRRGTRDPVELKRISLSDTGVFRVRLPRKVTRKSLHLVVEILGFKFGAAPGRSKQ